VYYAMDRPFGRTGQAKAKMCARINQSINQFQFFIERESNGGKVERQESSCRNSTQYTVGKDRLCKTRESEK
jgi:hypothetical protein